MYLCLDVAKYNLRFNLLPHILAAIGLLILTPIMFGITALDTTSAALPLEFALPFLGVILLTPVYSYEQESGILDTVRARKMPYILICGIRIIMATIIIFILISGFVLLMAALESQVSVMHALSSYSNAIFLGGLGILSSAVSGQAVIGYMVPILYFVLDLMGSFSSVTMFSIMRNGTMDSKWILLLIGFFCIISSLYIRTTVVKRK